MTDDQLHHDLGHDPHGMRQKRHCGLAPGAGHPASARRSRRSAARKLHGGKSTGPTTAEGRAKIAAAARARHAQARGNPWCPSPSPPTMRSCRSIPLATFATTGSRAPGSSRHQGPAQSGRPHASLLPLRRHSVAEGTSPDGPCRSRLRTVRPARRRAGLVIGAL